MRNASYLLHGEVIFVLAAVYVASLIYGFNGDTVLGALIAQCANTGAKAAVRAAAA